MTVRRREIPVHFAGRAFSALVASTLATSGLAAVAIPQPALAATDVVVGAIALPFLDNPVIGDMVPVGESVWLSHDNQIDVVTLTGTKQSSITGLFGVKDLAVSADGHSVYAALSQGSTIVKLDAATGARQAAYDVGGCPTHLALAATRLVYTYGCGTAESIGSISLADGKDNRTSTARLWGGGLIAAAGHTVVGATAWSGADLTTFSLADNGTLAERATGSHGSAAGDLAMSPDGTSILVTSMAPYGIQRYATAGLTPTGFFETGPYPAAVAYDATGSLLAGGLHWAYAPQLFAFDAVAGTRVAAAQTRLAGNQPDVVRGTLSFSADGSQLIALGDLWTGSDTYYLLSAGLQAQRSATVTAKAKNPKAYGGVGNLTVTTPGRPGTDVTVTFPAGFSPRTASVTTNDASVASLPFRATRNGTVQVSTAVSAAWTAASTSVVVTVPAKATVALSGYDKTVSGVRSFASASKVKIDVQALPATTKQVKATLQTYSGGQWVTRQVTTSSTDSAGTLTLGLKSATAGVTSRVRVQVLPDGTNAASRVATTPVFVVRKSGTAAAAARPALVQ